ncbi:MAG: alanine racemase [Calditrichaeota bacterium]|nr:alanine racemase [Calditrichota bacterium]
MSNTCRPTFAEIDLNAIAHNINEIKAKVAPAHVMAVVKANAYGHGAVPVAKMALENGAGYLGVALVEEGIELRDADIPAAILVFGGFFEHQVAAFLEYDLDATVFDLKRAAVLSNAAIKAGKSVGVHVKVDTGMGRMGLAWQDAVGFVQEISELKGLNLVGVYTHFATSDAKDKRFAREQLQRFQSVISGLDAAGVRIPLKHAANSGAILDLPEASLDMVRAGVALYGYYPSTETTESIALKPAMSLKSQVVDVKDISAGGSVSYGLTFEAKEDTQIGVIPVGYADGYNRLLSNQGEVLIRGRRCPVAGRVCMDEIMVNLGLGSGVRVGDEVVLLGPQGGDEITIYEICERLDTIPYEVTCWISQRVPREHTN